MDGRMMRALLGSRDAPELVFRRTYHADVAELRSACTEPGRLARWVGTVHPMPRGVGDAFTVALSDDPHDRATARVLRCDDDAIAVRWSWQGERESTISLHFVPLDDDRTELILRHALTQPEHAAGYGGGWEQMLQALARAVDAAHKDRPPDDELEREGAARWRTMAQHALEMQQRVNAPIRLVWRAFTTVDGLRSWWWRHWPDLMIEIDPRVGGAYRFVVPSQGIELSGEFLTINEPDQLAYTWRWSDAEGITEDEAVEIRLRAEADTTVVTVRHTGPWADAGPAASYRQGWRFVLGELAAMMSG